MSNTHTNPGFVTNKGAARSSSTWLLALTNRGQAAPLLPLTSFEIRGA